MNSDHPTAKKKEQYSRTESEHKSQLKSDKRPSASEGESKNSGKQTTTYELVRKKSLSNLNKDKDIDAERHPEEQVPDLKDK